MQSDEVLCEQKQKYNMENSSFVLRALALPLSNQG